MNDISATIELQNTELTAVLPPPGGPPPQDLRPNSAPTFAGLTLSGLAANGLLFTGTGGALTRLPLGAGLAIVGGALTATGGGGSGSVTSVGLSAPAGFSVTGSPVTGSGTLGLVFAAGYSLPTDARQAQWDSAVTLAGTAVQPGALAAGLAGKADLDGTGKVPAAQLPGFVDDVVEFANVAAFPVAGEAGKLYISLATNRQYRWSGSIYAEISPSPGSTDAVPEGSVNLYFTSTRGQTAAAAWWASSAPAAKLAGIADNATANLGTVTSIGLVAPTGFSTTGAITTSGNITLSFAAGYSLPTDTRQADWDAAFTQRRTWDGGDQHLNAATGRASLQLGTAAQAATTDFATPAALASGLAGKADLVGGVVPSSQIPAIAISDYLGSVASQAAMLALVGQRGDWCIRTDGASAGAWILSGEPSSLLANWVQIPMPAVPVQSVNGQVGVVTLVAGDVGAAPASHTQAASTISDFTSAARATVSASGSLSYNPTTGVFSYTAPTPFDPASPGAIGGTTPAAGTFTGLILPAQGSAPAVPATGFRLFAAASNALSWIGANGFRRTFDGTANTADRVYTLPDASGTVGLLSSATPQPPAATASAGTATDAARADHVHQFQPSDLVIPLSGESASLTVSTVLTIPYWSRAQVLTAIPIWMVNTAPAGAALQFDIRIGGTSIFSTLPTIAAGGTNSTTTTAAVFSTAFVSGGQTIDLGSSVTFLVTQIGSSTAGAGLKVAMPARRAS